MSATAEKVALCLLLALVILTYGPTCNSNERKYQSARTFPRYGAGSWRLAAMREL